MMLMLDQLSHREIADLISLTQQFKKRFATVAQQVLEVAREKNVDERVARLAVASECLLLSALMYTESDELFVEAARKAIEDADKKRPKVGLQ